jgi:hypothetical protein
LITDWLNLSLVAECELILVVDVAVLLLGNVDTGPRDEEHL